jgi:hypothetical protein
LGGGDAVDAGARVSAPVTVVLDNEAVQALARVAHPKHRRVLAFIDEINRRNQRGGRPISVVVPVAVRVEAGWDRTAPGAALVNRLARARDVVLDGPAADRSARLRREAAVSVVDATVAHAAEASAAPAVILTSDAADIGRLAALVAGTPRVVRI